MAAVAAALLHPLQQQVVSSVLRALQERLRYFFVSKETSAQLGGLMDNLRVENLEIDSGNLTRELQRFEIPLSAVGGSIKCVEVRLYLSHARLDIIATGCCLTLIPNDLQQTSGPLLDVIDKRLEEVQSHIAQFYSLQQVFQLQQQLDRLERLLQLQEERRFSESQQWHAAKGITLQNQYRELLERQQRASASVETPMQSLLQWLLRYLPNVNLRIDGLKISIDDTVGFFGPPAVVELAVKRLILQPSVAKVPWGFTWPCDIPRKTGEDTLPSMGDIHLGPQKRQQEEKSAFAVEVNVYQMSLVMIRSTTKGQNSTCERLRSDILEAADFSLQVYLQTERFGGSQNKNGSPAGDIDEASQQWRLHVHIIAEKPVLLNLDCFAILYLSSMRLKIKQTKALSGINVYKPRVRPNKDPRSWWRFARTHARLLSFTSSQCPSFCAEVSERILHMKRFVRVMKKLILQHDTSGVAARQHSQQEYLDVRALFRPVIARYLEQQRKPGTEWNSHFGMHEDEDDTFLLLQITRRPYWAVAQWSMIASKELAFAKQQLLLREDPDMVYWNSLDERLQRLNKRRLIIVEERSRENSANGHCVVPSLSELGGELKALEEEACDIRHQMQRAVERCHQSLVSFFETPSEFCRQARTAAVELEKSRRQLQQQLHQHQTQHSQPGSCSRRGTVIYEDFERQQAVAAAAAADLQQAQRKVWERTRERMMLWAIFYAVYRQLFPSLPLASVKAETMDAVLEQHALHQLEKELFKTYTSKGRSTCSKPLRVRPAVRLNQQGGSYSKYPTQQEVPLAACAIPRLLMRLRSGIFLPLPWWLQRLRFGVLLRRMAIRLAPQIIPAQPLKEKAEEGSERQWLLLEATDGAVEFSSAGEMSLFACLRTLEVFICNGRCNTVSGGTGTGNRTEFPTHGGTVWRSEFLEFYREQLLKLAHEVKGGRDVLYGTAINGKEGRSDFSKPFTEGSPGIENNVVDDAHPQYDAGDLSRSSKRESVDSLGGCTRNSLWDDALDIVGKAASAAVAAVVADGNGNGIRRFDQDQQIKENGTWRMDSGTAERISFGEDLLKPSGIRASVPGSSSSSGLRRAKESFQNAVRERHFQEQALSRRWNYLLMQLVSAPFQQPKQQRHERIKVGVPLYMRISGHLQHLSGDFQISQLATFQHIVQQLMVILCGAAVASRTDLGVGASDGRSDSVNFFCNLLSNYERHNRTLLYRYRLELQKHKQQLLHMKQQKQIPVEFVGGSTEGNSHEAKGIGMVSGTAIPPYSVNGECGSFEYRVAAPHDVTYEGTAYTVSREPLTTDSAGNSSTTMSAPTLPVTVDLSFVTERLGSALRVTEQRQQNQSSLFQYFHSLSKGILLHPQDSSHGSAGNSKHREETTKTWQDVLGLIAAKVRVQLPSIDIVMRGSRAAHQHFPTPVQSHSAAANGSGGAMQFQSSESLINGCLAPVRSTAVLMRIRIPTQTVSAIQTSRRNGCHAPSVCHISLGSVGSIFVPCSCSMIEILPHMIQLLRTHFCQLSSVLQLIMPWPSRPLAQVMTTLEQRVKCTLGVSDSSKTRYDNDKCETVWTQHVFRALSQIIVQDQPLEEPPIEPQSDPLSSKENDKLLCVELFSVSRNAHAKCDTVVGNACSDFELPGSVPSVAPKPAKWKARSTLMDERASTTTCVNDTSSGRETESVERVVPGATNLTSYGDGRFLEDKTKCDSFAHRQGDSSNFPDMLIVGGDGRLPTSASSGVTGSGLPTQKYKEGAMEGEPRAKARHVNSSGSYGSSVPSLEIQGNQSAESPLSVDNQIQLQHLGDNSADRDAGVGPQVPCKLIVREYDGVDALEVLPSCGDANGNEENRRLAEEGLTNMGLRKVRGSDAFKLYL